MSFFRNLFGGGAPASQAGGGGVRIPRRSTGFQQFTRAILRPDGQTVQFSVAFANGDAASPAALASVTPMRADVQRVAQAAGASASGGAPPLSLA